MKCFAIIAIAFASVAVACKDDNIFCAPGYVTWGTRYMHR